MTFIIFPISALVVTALVALLPHRLRRGGARSSWFFSSPAHRLVEVGLMVAVAAVSVVVIVRLCLGERRGLNMWSWAMFALSGLAWLRFARRRINAPTLSDVVTTDARPAVLYLRAFRQEFDPFVFVRGGEEELSRYTRRPTSRSTIPVTLEQYLGPEFARQVGPLIALGNPLDALPPEGAVRSYASDEDWQQHFATLAATAAAIVLDGSRSSNLTWELAETTRNGWSTKLFFLTPPTPPAPRSIGGLVYAVRASAGRLWFALLRSTKGIRVNGTRILVLAHFP